MWATNAMPGALESLPALVATQIGKDFDSGGFDILQAVGHWFSGFVHTEFKRAT